MHLSESARAVFAVLAASSTATRPQLATGARLSKPTVSTAVAELEAAGLAARSGTLNGGTGRSAAVYDLGLAAGAVLAVDLGPSVTRVRVCGLDGTLLAEGTGPRADTVDVVAEALARLSAGAPLRAIVVAVGDVTTQSREGAGVRPATAKAGPIFDALTVALPPGVPVHVENNVNCAALAELHEGAARGRDTFGYLRIGVGIGLGVVIGGHVLRGSNGAAGEVARLPYPWDADREPRHEGLEAHIGAGSLLRRAADAWRGVDGLCPDTVDGLFALADAGPDLIALEELVPTALPAYERTLAPGYPYHAVRGTVGLWSRHPLTAARLVDIKPEGIEEEWSRGLRAVVRTPRGEVVAYVAHLPSVRVGAGGLASRWRDESAVLLGRAVAAEKRNPVILLGDLNGTVDDRGLAPLTARMNVAERGFAFSYPAGLALTRIDQVMARSAAVADIRTLPATGSDHLPVAARVTLD